MLGEWVWDCRILIWKNGNGVDFGKDIWVVAFEMHLRIWKTAVVITIDHPEKLQISLKFI